MFNSADLIQRVPMLEGRLHYAQTLTSTNDVAADLIRSGAKSGTLVLAENQTKGRGRGENKWYCDNGEGLLFSLILEPNIKRDDWPKFALVAAVAVATVLEKYTLNAQIKWPNDIWLNGKKCAGILIEGCEKHVIIGMGINVSQKKFPQHINATSLSKEMGSELKREPLLALIIQSIISWISRSENDYESIIKQVNQRCLFLGQKVQIEQNNKMQSGIMHGVNSKGHLIIENDGITKVIAHASRLQLST